jgi:aminoglycoside phosphotransferase (APT) family kinase protein
VRIIGEGFGSKVYATDDGKIVRVAKNRATQEKHERERIVLDTLKWHIRSVAIPEPSIFVQPSERYPYGAIGYDEIPGKPLQPAGITPALRQPLAHQVAQFISELHSIPLAEIKRVAELPPYLPTPDALQELWSRVSAYVDEHAPQLHTSLEIAFARSVELAEKQREPQVLLHGDLWYENMIFNGNKIVGIVDFEAVSSGHPIVDFMTQGYVDDDFRRLVVAAYQDMEYDETLGKCLMFLREMRGLDDGITTQDIDEDSLEKLAHAASKL